MKKVFSLMLLLATIILTTDCSNNDKDEPDNSILAGTEWIAHAETGKGTWILEFVDGSNVICHCADDEGRITVYNTCAGTYSLNGSQITFRHVEFYWGDMWTWRFNSASIQKDRMIVSYIGGGLAVNGTIAFEKR